MQCFTTLLALVWKCLVLRRRNWLLTISELVLPTLVLIISYLLSVETNEYSRYFPPVHIDYRLRVYDYHQTPGNVGKVAFYARRGLQDVEEIIEKFKSSSKINSTSVTKLENRKAFEAWLENNRNYENAFEMGSENDVGIEFVEMDTKKKTFKYVIRVCLGDRLTNYGAITDVFYTRSPFLFVQMHLDSAILLHAGFHIKQTTVQTGKLVTTHNSPESFTKAAARFNMQLALIFAYIPLVVAIMRDTLQEKASGIKEMMKIMGATNWMIWAHWLLYVMIVQLPVTVIVTIFLSVLSPPMVDGSVIIVWLLIFLFTVDCTIMFFAITCFFVHPIRGTMLCVFAWIVINIIAVSLTNDPGDYNTFHQVLISLIPLQNLTWAFYSINSFTWYPYAEPWSLFSEGFSGYRLPTGVSIIIFLVKTLFFTLLLIYLDATKPGPYGTAKPAWFFISWIVERFQKNNPFYATSISSVPGNFEPPPKGIEVGVSIRGLRKEFGMLKKVMAVDRVDLDMYKGEIMALLGHNGAGKTTTMSMISGIFSPTSGTILVDGINIHTEQSRFRKHLGLCTQHNLYFPKLTVLEHLIFFGMLKGSSYSTSKTEGRYLLDLLNISEKANSKGSQLSGGTLRRLCLAVSLTGRPKVLILDEPTSGLDPENRRHILDLLLKLRGDRTVLITTHSMEEADILGDRIAIMDHGKVVCCGTSMFLKKIYGAGYHIHVLKKPEASQKDITNLVFQSIPQVKVMEISQTQVDYVVKEEHVDKFPGLFQTLENNKNLSIVGISVTCSTLEDVFLKISETSQDNSVVTPKLETSHSFGNQPKSRGILLFFQRFVTLVFKNFLHRSKGYVSFLVKLIITSLLIIYAVTRLKTGMQGEINKSPISYISLSLYPGSVTPIAFDVKSSFLEMAKDVITNHQGELENADLKNDKNMKTYLRNMSFRRHYQFLHLTLLAMTFGKDNLTVRYQADAAGKVHVPAVAYNIIANTLLKSVDRKGSIEIVNHPYVFLSKPEDIYVAQDGGCLERIFMRLFLSFILWIFIFTINLILVMADVISITIEDRNSGFKHQQIIAGVSPFLYWVANFISHFAVYMLVVFIWIVIIVIFGNHEMILAEIDVIILVLFLHGLSGLFHVYLYTLLFTSSTMCTAIFVTVNLIASIIMPILYAQVILGYSVYMILSLPFLLNPTLNAIWCMTFITVTMEHKLTCSVCPQYCKHYYDVQKLFRINSEEDIVRSGILLNIIFLALCWIPYAILLLVIDSNLIKTLLTLFTGKPQMPPALITEDVDVIMEFEKVKMYKQANIKTTPLRVESLVKEYESTRAVNKVTFLVEQGECFGLLGVNGAGKTTTFKMLTGEIFPSGGDAFASGYSVVSQRRRYLNQVGYCPQFDSFLQDMTAEENLKIMALLRGVPFKRVKGEVSSWIQMLGIAEHAKKRAVTYSGGTKRKLSTAMAFIGDPSVIFLDEPTTGVDPASRRKLWSVVQARQRTGQAIVLTSHSMEECDALCTRLTIMRAGMMQCIGSAEQLKTKFSQGYTVNIKLAEHDDKQVHDFKNEFERTFPNNYINDENITSMSYSVYGRVPLSRLFSKMLEFKKNFDIVDDFVVSNASLEQLFLSVARGDKPNRVLLLRDEQLSNSSL